MRVFLVPLAALNLSACAADIEDFNQAPPLSPVGSGLQSQSVEPAIADDETFSISKAGWIGGPADLFRDMRAYKTGDVITVRIEINDKAILNNSSNRSRQANGAVGGGLTYDVMGVTQADVNGRGRFDSKSSASGQGTTNRSERITLSVAAIVTKVLPNGYLVIEGSQEILVNFEQRVLNVAGIVRPFDVTPDNAIPYEKIAEARISYGGNGRLTEVQQPGWGQQIWDRIAPF